MDRTKLPSRNSKSFALAGIAIGAALALAAAAEAAGRIVITHDEWTLSNSGFSAPNDPVLFANNCIAWMAGPGPAQILIHSSNFGLVGSSLKTGLEAAGHTLTYSTVPLTLAAAQNYDAIFICGIVVDNQVLIDYVNGGGGVYICAGTSAAFNPSAQYGTFLGAFGLGYDPALNGVGGSQPIASAHPIFAGVDSLFQSNGNDVLDLDAGSSANQVLVVNGAHELYAVYDGGGVPCPADLNGDGTVSGLDLTIVLSNWGAPGGPADLDGNGTVGGTDLTVLLSNWGPCP